MNRGCPATRKFYHVFDKTTHRCKCGRWERGFKPKVEPVAPRAECQICERHQALDNAGCLVHHGYTRPGYGFIQGDCMGVRHKPYKATDALEIYLRGLKNRLANLEVTLINHPETAEISYSFGYRANRQTITVTRGQKSQIIGSHWVPDFDKLLKIERMHLETEIRLTRQEITRVENRIEGAKS